MNKLNLILLLIFFSSCVIFAKDYYPNDFKNLKVLNNKVIVRLKPNTNFSSFYSKLKSFDAVLQKQLLDFKSSYTYKIHNKQEITLRPNEDLNKILKTEEPLLRTYYIIYNSGESPHQFCNKLIKNFEEVEIAEPIYIDKPLQYFPDDPLAPQQILLTKCQIIDAWSLDSGDTNVIIGISDVGVDQNHEDLQYSIAINWSDPLNNIDDDGNGYIDDFKGYDFANENSSYDNTYSSHDHGTNVSGIAAATVNNGVGIAGVANKCKIFPIKTSVNNELIFSYESIIYAAIRGFKVLNCSWGIEKPYSEIDQSIINYAIARDVAIVASGGNTTGSFQKNYPSAYHGVLAVGEVDQMDNFSGNNLGEYIDILAPGKGNWYPLNISGYSNSGSGSSYAAPVVAGVVALVRSKYPQLNALQALELVRLTADDVSKITYNYYWKDLLPGRVNAYKALNTDPFSMPSIRPEKSYFKDLYGNIIDRFAVGDTVILDIDAFNYLGEADNLTFKLSAIKDDYKSIRVLDSIINIGNIEENSEIKIGSFKFTINSENESKMFFRIDIYGDNNYHDFFLIEFIPTPLTATFSNEVIKFSASDAGTIGFGGNENNRQGIGFEYKHIGNQLWKSCFFAFVGNNKYVSSLYWDIMPGNNNDFIPEKKLVPPERNICIFNDNNAISSLKLGIQVKQEFIIPKGQHSIAKVNIEIKNTNHTQLDNFAAGYYFDWDVNNSDSNKVELLPEAIPNHLLSYPAAVEIIQYTDKQFPIFGCGVISYENQGHAQAAGINNQLHQIYNEDIMFNSLTSGTSFQDIGVFDASCVVGMYYPGSFSPNEIKKFSICFGAADNKNDFIEKMKRALDTTYTKVENKNNNSIVNIYPNPAKDIVNIEFQSTQSTKIDLEIIDELGRTIQKYTETINNIGKINWNIDLSKYSSGIYNIIIKYNNDIINKKLFIVK